MKIGRNASCPCGSGKKYKKCCLNKSVSPPETLHYRRLSKALEQLMPELIDHGFSIFGETADGMAMAEFLGWPDLEEVPDDETIERVGMLFWPWFVFNWEFDSLDYEDSLPDVPEGATIAELYSESNDIDSQSLVGKLINAANRMPYSFMEILSIKPGKSVHIRDVLTGAEVQVQENLGSEMLSLGDILYGRVLQVEGVGMFLGLSAIIIPPRMKPQLIDLRRSLSRGGKELNRDDLYDWDLEIRVLFLELDRALHTQPEMRNTDGDPMEFQKLSYDIDSSDLAVEKLASLCTSETVVDIRAAAEIERDYIADVRQRLKLERPLRRKPGTSDPKQLAERIAQIKNRIAEFGGKRLHDTYTEFATRLCDAVAATDQLYIHRGRIDIWAAAIVYAIAQLNFLFSSETPHHLTPEELCNWFKVKKTTVSSKAGTIRNTLDLYCDDERFCASHITGNFQFFEDENGFIIPAGLMEGEGERKLEPIPLKPGPEKDKANKAVNPKIPAKKPDDRQLSLFEE